MSSRQAFAYNGLGIKAVKKNYAVWPVVGCIVLGSTMALAYTLRLFFRCPDVTWCPKKDPEPWQRYANKEYKFFQTEKLDVKNYKHPRPPF